MLVSISALSVAATSSSTLRDNNANVKLMLVVINTLLKTYLFRDSDNR